MQRATKGALQNGTYQCFLSENTQLPMMYMDDAIRATTTIMESEVDSLTVRSSYNLGSMSFTPKQIAQSIKAHIPEFEITYQPDFRQEIADSWPSSIDDEMARTDWGWKPSFDLEATTKSMLENLGSTSE